MDCKLLYYFPVVQKNLALTLGLKYLYYSTMVYGLETVPSPVTIA